MRIFYKRPLSLILCIMLGSFVFFSFYEYFILRILSAISAFIIFTLTFLKAFPREKATLTRITAICSLFAMLFSFLYFDLWFKAYDRYEDEVKIVGTVEAMERHSYRTEVLIKTDNVDDSFLSSYKLIAYISNENYYGYSIGSKIEFTGIIEDFSSSDSSFDIESYNFSRGISGVINEVKDFKILDIGEPTLSHKIWAFRQSICRRLIYNSNADIGGLLSALLLGEKAYLPTGTKLDFSRIGISHILALSGMHLAILTLGFSRFLAFFRVGKKKSTVITVIFTLLYMAVTGFSVSVVRAGIMLIVSSILYLLARSRDSMTSLFISVFFICVLEPYSIYDMSLWLSAFATLGIVVMSEYQSRKYTKPSLFKWLTTSLLSTVFAISATFFLTISKFDGISLLSPISTLLFSLLVEVFIYIGLLLLLFGSFLPIKIIIAPIGYAIIHLARMLSGIDTIYVSSNFLSVEILTAVFTVAFFAFFILNVQDKHLALLSLGAALTVIFILSASLTYSNQERTQILYENQRNEQLIISESGEICVIDVSDYEKSTAYGAYRVIANENLTKLDKYIVTHYSYDLEESIATLTSSMLIKEIYLPLPKNATEERIFLGICKATPPERTKITLYQKEDIIGVGEAYFIPIHRYELSTQKKLLFTILYEDSFYTYLNIDMLYKDTKNMALEVIDGSRAVIFGRHESGRTERKFTYKLSEPSLLVFSSERIIIPMDTLKYYSNYDVYFKAERVSLIR